MMRNTEWGAVAYLSHSKYGINNEVRKNNNSNFLTGYAAKTSGAAQSTTNNSPYNTSIGYLASTTGNITGIYDMGGGAWEYMASYRASTPGNSGFTTEELVTYANHLDVYPSDSGQSTFNKRILGDATGEMGPFYSASGNYFNNWYGNSSIFIDSTNSWFLRGGHYVTSSTAGQFYFGRNTGAARPNGGFRITLSPRV